MIKKFFRLNGIPVCEDRWDKFSLIPEPSEIFEDEAIQDHEGNWCHWGNYYDYRRQSYPPMGDQLDVLFKALQELDATSMLLSRETKAFIQKIKDIKDRYPKKS